MENNSSDVSNLISENIAINIATAHSYKLTLSPDHGCNGACTICQKTNVDKTTSPIKLDTAAPHQAQIWNHLKNEVKVYVGGSWAALLLLLWDRRQRGLCGRFRVSFPIFCEEKSVVPKFHMTLTP